MKILALIPARGGSKGVPGKNIKLLGGKPLLAYTSEIALQSKHLTTIIVSTEDDKIVEVAESLGIKVPFKRPAELAQDTTPTIDAIVHALKWYQKQNVFFDAVCLLQVTSPFRTIAFLDKAIEKFIEKDTDSLVSVQRVPHEYNPHWTFKLANSFLSVSTGDESIISRRQDLPDTWHRDGKIYITTPKLIMEGKILGEKLVGFVNDEEPNVNIDTLEDWELAENLFRNGFIF